MSITRILEPSPAGHMAKGRKEVKDEQLFARLIGAAVLLAVAVIVLPFVLDGSGSQREYEYAETLPVEPPRPVVEKSFSSRQPVTGRQVTGDSASVVPIPRASDTRASDKPITRNVEVSIPPTTSLAGLESSQSPQVLNPAATTEELANAVATAANGGQGPAVQPSGTVTNMPIQPGWNIQVASFVRDNNAVKLMNKLQSQNLPSYANRVDGKSRSLIRVLVGPINNQIDALALQNRIDRDYRVESLMVKR